MGSYRRALVLALGLVGLAVAGLASACDRTPAAPSLPPAGTPAPPSAIGLALAGPTTVTPGSTTRYTATAEMSDGSTRDVTDEAAWRSNNSSFSIVSAGVVAAPSRADQFMLSVSYRGLSATREVIAVPDGTYRLTGIVSDRTPPAGPVSLATVEVDGRYVSSTAFDGRYNVLGVAGRVTIRVTKIGYYPHVEQVTVDDHRTLNVDLTPSYPLPDFSGTYRLDITAADDCSASLPPEVMRRTYSAALRQVGPSLTMTLSQGAFVSVRYGAIAPEPTATVDALVSQLGVHFTLGTLGCSGYYYGCGPTIFEQLSPLRFFMPSGSARLVPVATGLAGELDGFIEIHAGTGPERFQRVASCRSTRHQIVLSR
jgi:hypothetical protein